MKANLITVTVQNLRKGDIVHFHGARFEILADATPSIWHDTVFDAAGNEQSNVPAVAWALGRWIGGEIVPGYFGPHSEDWTFQGNQRAIQWIEPRLH